MLGVIPLTSYEVEVRSRETSSSSGGGLANVDSELEKSCRDIKMLHLRLVHVADGGGGEGLVATANRGLVGQFVGLEPGAAGACDDGAGAYVAGACDVDGRPDATGACGDDAGAYVAGAW